MSIDRRRLFAALAGAGAAVAAGEVQSVAAREFGPRTEIDAASLGLRPNASEDQTQALQRAIEQAAAARTVLKLPSGFIVLARCSCRHTRPWPACRGRRASSCREGRR